MLCVVLDLFGCGFDQLLPRIAKSFNEPVVIIAGEVIVTAANDTVLFIAAAGPFEPSLAFVDFVRPIVKRPV